MGGSSSHNAFSGLLCCCFRCTFECLFVNLRWCCCTMFSTEENYPVYTDIIKKRSDELKGVSEGTTMPRWTESRSYLMWQGKSRWLLSCTVYSIKKKLIIFWKVPISGCHPLTPEGLGFLVSLTMKTAPSRPSLLPFQAWEPHIRELWNDECPQKDIFHHWPIHKNLW